MKTFSNYRFLSFNIALIHAALTGPSFGNLCMIWAELSILNVYRDTHVHTKGGKEQ